VEKVRNLAVIMQVTDESGLLVEAG